MNDIKITQKPVADLIPYSRNPRRNDEAVPMVMNSIKQFGFKVPIVVDRNNIIVCGHTRFKAALKQFHASWLMTSQMSRLRLLG